MPSTRRTSALPFLAALAIGAACEGADVGPSPSGETPTAPAAPTPVGAAPSPSLPGMRRALGDSQTGLVETALADSLAVGVTDADGRPVAGVRIRFEIASGDGRVAGSATTDSAGLARVQWVLGDRPGPQTVRATDGTSTTTFTAVAGAAVRPSFAVALAASRDGVASPNEAPTDEQFDLRASGVVRGVMLFVDFSDAPAVEPTGAVYGRVVPGTQAWLRTSSYGQMALDVTPVARWYRLPRPAAAYQLATGEAQAWRDYLADAIATADRDVDFSAYQVVYVVPTQTRAIPFGPAWPFTPGAGVTSREGEVRHFVTLGADSYDPARARAIPISLAHETAHLFGLPDLYTVQPGTTLHDLFPFAGGWDIMSWIAPGADFVAWHKLKLGWLRPAEVKWLVAGGLEAELTPIEVPGGLKMIALPIGTASALVLELRRPVTLDAGLCDHGLLLYTVDALVRSGHGPLRVIPVARGTDARMLDRCSVLYDATLDRRPGKSARYEDAALGVSVEVLASSPDGVRVRVRRR